MQWDFQEIGDDGRDPGRVNPYEEWDSVLNPPDPAAPDPWHPVFIALLPGEDSYKSAATALLKLLTEDPVPDIEEVRAPMVTLRNLRRILEQDGQDLAFLSRVFVYRGYSAAYDSKPLEDLGIACDVLHVGPAILGWPPTRFTEAAQLLLPLPAKPDGAPVVTAIVDDEIGFLNDRFRQTPTRTRIQRFWSMGLRGNEIDKEHLSFGAYLNAEGIDAHLEELAEGAHEAELYARFDARPKEPAPTPQKGPFRNPNLRRPRQLAASHGTAVLDLAAGQQPQPDTHAGSITAPILAVELPQLATAETDGGRLEGYLLLAVMQILDWADTLSPEDGKVHAAPLVINISYGIHAGPKDGTGFLEDNLRRLAEGRSAVAPTKIVLSAGNNYRSEGHAQLALHDQTQQKIRWRVQPDSTGYAYLEIHARNTKGGVLMIAPPGSEDEALPFFRMDGPSSISYAGVGAGGPPIAGFYLRQYPASESASDRCTIVVALAPTRPHAERGGAPAPAGEYVLSFWRQNSVPTTEDPVDVTVETQRGDTPTGYETGARQSYLVAEDAQCLDPDTGRRDAPSAGSALIRAGTLTAYGSAQSDHLFVVGGAYPLPDDVTPKAALYSSAGPTYNQRLPDLAAISEEGEAHVGVAASGLFSGSMSIYHGTSMAAPRITRKLAEALQHPATHQASKAALIEYLLEHGQAFDDPDPQLGHGIARTKEDRLPRYPTAGKLDPALTG